MKQLIFILSIGFFSQVIGQEKLNPLAINPTIYNPEAQSRASELNNLDSTFIYTYAPLELKHVWDDFAINKFETFSSGYADGGVTSELFYRLMDPTNSFPQEPSLIFCDGEFAHHDTVKVDDAGVLIDRTSYYPFAAYDVWVNDLDFYPVGGELVENLYQECYVLIDSIIDGVVDADQDTIWYNTQPGPAFIQDSARVFTKNVTDTTTLWLDNYAYRNYTYAVNPWSLGVATFDGLNEFGTPYEFGDLTAHGIADYLTSRPIDLSEAVPGDMVYLEFIYQAQGFGNMPEANDTLLIDMYDPLTEEWYKLDWAGNALEVGPNNWDTAFISIPSYFFKDGFQFRFKNYATLSGALDHWHIDYVRLKISLIDEPETFSDLAIMYPVNTVLKDYTHVPWDHYVNTTGNEKIKSTMPVPIFNSDNSNTDFSPGLWTIHNEGVLESSYSIPISGGLDPALYFEGFNDCFIPVDGGFFYDQGLGGIQAKFDFKLNISTDVAISNKYKHNDTTTFTQRFDNYYAYDDGSAEGAYGIEGTSALMAYKFEAYEAGNLTGILMHFVPSVNDFSEKLFLLTVWADNDGVPGEIIYQDDYFESHSPEYSGGINAFRYYKFTRDEYTTIVGDIEMLAVGEVFYVGWQNIGSESLNIGADLNIDNGEKVFRNTGGGWISSAYDMSLMIRPVFSTNLDGTLAVDDRSSEQGEITVYPNPAKNQFSVSGLASNTNIQLYDLSGRVVLTSTEFDNIDISLLDSGVYIIAVQDKSGAIIYSSKLIKE